MASGLRLKLLTFYPPWKVWPEFNTFDPSQTWLTVPTPRSREMLDEETCLQAFRIQLIESLGLYIQVTYCEIDRGDFLILWPFFLLSSIYIFVAILRDEITSSTRAFSSALLVSSFPKLCCRWMGFSCFWEAVVWRSDSIHMTLSFLTHRWSLIINGVMSMLCEK